MTLQQKQLSMLTSFNLASSATNGWQRLLEEQAMGSPNTAQSSERPLSTKDTVGRVNFIIPTKDTIEHANFIKLSRALSIMAGGIQIT